jgi:hypothetical protein
MHQSRATGIELLPYSNHACPQHQNMFGLNEKQQYDLNGTQKRAQSRCGCHIILRKQCVWSPRTLRIAFICYSNMT